MRLTKAEKDYLNMLAHNVSGGKTVRGWGVHAAGTIYEGICESLTTKGVIKAYGVNCVRFADEPRGEIIEWAESLA